MKENRRFKLVIFDLDGTLTQERSIWEYIHKDWGSGTGLQRNIRSSFWLERFLTKNFVNAMPRFGKG